MINEYEDEMYDQCDEIFDEDRAYDEMIDDILLCDSEESARYIVETCPIESVRKFLPDEYHYLIKD